MNKKNLLSATAAVLVSFNMFATTVAAAPDSAASSSQTAGGDSAVDNSNSAATTTDKAPNDNNAADTSGESAEAAPTSDSAAANKPATTDKSDSKISSHALSLAGKVVKAKKNSYVYTSKGKRVKNKKIKKNTIEQVIGVVAIKGKSYIQISKKKYAKAANFKKIKLVSYTLKRNAKVYNKKGQPTGYYYKKGKGKRVTVIATKKIKGKKYVKVTGANNYLRWSNLNNKSGKIVSQ